MRARVKFVAEKTNKLLTIVREAATRMAQAQAVHQQPLMDSLEAIVTYCRHNMTADGNQFFPCAVCGSQKSPHHP